MSKIIPYVQDETKQWSIPDNLMTQIFVKMAELKLSDTVFSNGTVINHIQWLMFVQNKKNVVNIVGNDKQVEGVTWLNSFGLNYAFGHFCFFPETWGKNSVELGRMVIDYWFNGLKSDEFCIDVILGQIPASNLKAIGYTEKLGMKTLGTVPDIKYQNGNETGAYFCFITRKEFNNGR